MPCFNGRKDPLFMQQMYCECVYISFLARMQRLGFAAENYSVCAVQLFIFYGPQNEAMIGQP